MGYVYLSVYLIKGYVYLSVSSSNLLQLYHLLNHHGNYHGVGTGCVFLTGCGTEGEDGKPGQVWEGVGGGAGHLRGYDGTEIELDEIPLVQRTLECCRELQN